MTTTTMGSAEAGELRNRLATCNLADLGGKDWFLLRLQRETGWSRAFALGALAEYLRFCELCVLAGGESTSPGPVIDQVWHLHLLETRHYWTEFCPRVLGQNLHHAPARPGAAEAPLSRARHARTLKRYAQAFGTAAPAHYWPDWSTALWAAAPRKRWRVLPLVGWLLALLLPASATAADALAFPEPERWDWGGVSGWLLLALLLVGTLAWRRIMREPGRGVDLEHMDPVALAFAASGRWRAFDTAMSELVAGEHVQLDVTAGWARVRGDAAGARLSPWSLTLWQSLRRSGAVPLASMEQTMLDCWAELERSLRQQGVLHSATAERQRQWLRVPWLIWILFLLPQLLARHFHIGTFLLLLASVMACVAIGSRLGATDRTRACLKSTRDLGPSATMRAGDELPRAVALYSLRPYADHPLLADFVRLRRQQVARSEAATEFGVEIGCSDRLACSGGGGDGDGGGCGGCGGD